MKRCVLNQIAFRWRADDGPTLNAHLVPVIFQGIRTSIAKETLLFVIFQGGGPDPLSLALDPCMTLMQLNAGQKYCRMLQESTLQYFRPTLSYHLPLRPLFCLFLSGRLRQVSMKSST